MDADGQARVGRAGRSGGVPNYRKRQQRWRRVTTMTMAMGDNDDVDNDGDKVDDDGDDNDNGD